MEDKNSKGPFNDLNDSFEYFIKHGHRCRYETPDEERTRKEGRPSSFLQPGYELIVRTVRPKVFPENNMRGTRYFTKVYGNGWVKPEPVKELDECFEVVDLIQMN